MMMQLPFYIAGAIAIFASLKVVLGSNAIHALLYLVVSLLAVAVCFYFLGAPFAAGLEVIVYAGAILVLFVFAVMMFDLQGDDADVHFSGQYSNPQAGKNSVNKPGQGFGHWFGPCILAFILLAEFIYVLAISEHPLQTSTIIDAKEVGTLLYGPYLLAVEIASFLLLSGLIGGYHLAKDTEQDKLGGHL